MVAIMSLALKLSTLPNSIQFQLLDGITRAPLHDLFQISSSQVTEEIKKIERDFEIIFTRVREAIKIFKEAEAKNEAKLASEWFRECTMIAIASTGVGVAAMAAYLRFRPSLQIAIPVAFVASFCVGAITSVIIVLLGTKAQLEKLPNLGLLSNEVNSMVDLKLQSIEKKLLELDAASQKFSSGETAKSECQHILKERDQLISAKSFFEFWKV
jgi:hypothetical protein